MHDRGLTPGIMSNELVSNLFVRNSFQDCLFSNRNILSEKGVVLFENATEARHMDQ